MRIQHNIAALNSHRQLGSNNSSVSKNLERLSSGYRINRAGDDAAGLAISEKMRAQITGLNTASKNSQDGISLVQTAEGALTEVHSMLNRMTELAGQAANGTYQDEVDRENAMKELDSLRTEVDRISQSTNYNGINLLDGSLGGGGSIAAKNVKILNATTGDSAAAAGQYTAGKAIASTMDKDASKDGDKFELSITYKDTADSAERTKTFSLTLKTKTDGTKVLVGEGGKEHSINDFDAAGVTVDDISKALTTDLVASNLSDKFKITGGINNGAAEAFVFEAKESGSSGAVVTSMAARTVKSGILEDEGLTVTIPTPAEDSYKTLALGGITAYTGSNPDAAIFKVNGQKFVLADVTAGSINVSGLDKDVTILDGADFTAAHAATISQKTGLDVTVDNVVLTFKPAAGVAGKGGLSLQIGDTSDDFNQLTVAVSSMSSSSLGISGLDISTQDNAKAAVSVIKDAINKVSSTRGDLGAVQNRLEHTINNLGVTAENMTAAESRIRDVDMAQEMMNFTKNNILTQASQAMLAQANQLPQGVLQLLQ